MSITHTSACSALATQHAFLVINEVAVKVLELLQHPPIPATWLCHGGLISPSGASGVSACCIICPVSTDFCTS